PGQVRRHAFGGPAESPRMAKAEGISLDQLRRQLKTVLATILRIETSIIEDDKPFMEFGLDSFLGVEMILAINKKYGTELSNIKLFDHPTVSEFSLYLEQEIKKLPGYATEPPPEPVASLVAAPVPVASSPRILKKNARVSRKAENTQSPSQDKIA